MNKIRWITIAFWLLMTVLFLLPSRSFDGVGTFPFRIDYLVHVSLFAILSVLIIKSNVIITNRYRKLLLVLSMYGILIEILQHLLSLGRSFSWLDWFFDIGGVLLGIFIYIRYQRIK